MSVYFLLLSREVSLSNYFSREVQGRYCFLCREGTHGDLTILFCLVRWTFWTTKLLASNSTKRPRFFSHDASHASFCTAMTQNNNSQPQPSIAFLVFPTMCDGQRLLTGQHPLACRKTSIRVHTKRWCSRRDCRLMECYRIVKTTQILCLLGISYYLRRAKAFN